MDVEKIKAAAGKAIAPLRPVDKNTAAAKDFMFSAKRTNAGRSLPAYWLVYFLLVDLLGFRNAGQFEKVAWSVPVDFNGKALLIEHRKFGLGIFAGALPDDEPDAEEVARLIKRSVKAATPYFAWRAEEAAKASKLNVLNRGAELFERFEFFARLYADRLAEAERRKDERIKTQHSPTSWSTRYPSFELRHEAEHFAIAAIDSFFSWTEHVFILIAILGGTCATGEEVRQLARADWGMKFKAALDIADPRTKVFYDSLVHVRRQVRNFVAHGSFGKDGEAFEFHSTVGAVPMRMVEGRGPNFQFGAGAGYVDGVAIQLLHDFVAHLWSGSRKPAYIYIQDWRLPLILTMAESGEYARCMASVEKMKSYAEHLGHESDRHANMDF